MLQKLGLAQQVYTYKLSGVKAMAEDAKENLAGEVGVGEPAQELLSA